MKIYEIILEDKTEHILATRQDKLLNAYRKDQLAYSKKPNLTAKDILQILSQADVQGKYLVWIADQYINNRFRLEDIDRVKSAIEQFHKKKNQLSQKDIMAYKSLADLEDAVEDQEEVKSKRQQTKDIKAEGAELIAQDNSGSIYKLKTQEAACFYGSGTKWCTAASKNNMFDKYNKEGPLYVLIGKDGRKYQFHFHTQQYMDERDESVEINELMGKYPVIKKLLDYVRKRGIYLNDRGKLHREDGPAVIHSDGTKEWWLDGLEHREDGPAIIHPDGTKEWWLGGNRHREDGPAIIHPDGTKEWWLDDLEHREDGPAIIHPDGTELWYQDGSLHREDGPAVIHPDGTELWYQYGNLHREDGPAIIRANGTKEWYIEGAEYSEEEFDEYREGNK